MEMSGQDISILCFLGPKLRSWLPDRIEADWRRNLPQNGSANTLPTLRLRNALHPEWPSVTHLALPHKSSADGRHFQTAAARGPSRTRPSAHGGLVWGVKWGRCSGLTGHACMKLHTCTRAPPLFLFSPSPTPFFSHSGTLFFLRLWRPPF